MGHQAKYFTLEEKMAAARRHTESYLHSQRGKISTQTSYNIEGPAQPSTIFYIAVCQPSSSQFLSFRRSLNGSDLLDVSDLSQWDKAPPYNSLPPPDSPEEQCFTQNLFDVMHGHNLRMERESRAHRAAMYDAGEISEVLKELQDGQKRLLEGWDELNTRVADHRQVSARHKLMAECYRQGVARRILSYQEEVDLLVTGQSPYCHSP
ncbi:hypothetical protein DEU56DRAFT_912834 [Suillus clintonianus]|uniref:uncharacterized protein n=1 Tax=Suillus clintonianus TaxID=1904413 RepID=UPI001B874AE1|nr:uncharacterized protein DEU56DRAFT_912834 [Suillus clintonianus]KAG2137063.1 hypothetical protein DEU56DRAFT_912834 [Suillus clintonianus]